MDWDPRHQNPVYEEDQVITKQNLRDILQDFQEQQITGSLTDREMQLSNVCTATIKGLLYWLEKGKPYELSFEGEIE